MAGFMLAAVVALPVLTVASQLLVPALDVWAHLATTVLPDYLANTALLAVGVGIGVTAIGVGTAWLVTMCRFPGAGVFEWLLLLPLAVPTYIIAYAYTDLLAYAGPIQSTLRAMTGWTAGGYWFPEIRSLGGAIVVISLVLYPYVYLITRAAFLEQSVCALEVSRLAGFGPWRTFFRVALPLARPAIVGGVALALMETLAEFGAVQYFGVTTFTTGIYRTWFALGEPAAAAQLAAVLMLFVLTVIVLERVSRRSRRFTHTSGRYLPLPRQPLRGGRALAAFLACALPPALGFGVPLLDFLHMSLTEGDALFGLPFVSLVVNSFSLAALTALLATACALIIAYGMRLWPTRRMRVCARLAGVGYAIPGAVIAVGILIPFAAADRGLNALLDALFGWTPGLILTGTMISLVFAYLVRFMAVALNTAESGLSKIRPTMDDAARTLGYGPGETLLKIHVPLMRSSVLTAVTLVFVDVLKELPATLIVRPLNFETLAVRVYTLAADERLTEASTAALTIILVGILPVILLSRAIARSRPGSAAERQGRITGAAETTAHPSTVPTTTAT